jgi:hypothetical protein
MVLYNGSFIHQGGKLSRRTIVGIGQIRSKHSHVSVNDLVGEVHGDVVVLITVPGIEEDRLIQLFEFDHGLQALFGITIRPVSFGLQPNGLSGDQVVDHVSSAVSKLAGIHLIARVFIRDGRGPNEQIHGCKARVGRNVIKGCLPPTYFYSRLGMSDIKIGAGRAHGGEGAGGNHIHFLSGALRPLLLGEI